MVRNLFICFMVAFPWFIWFSYWHLLDTAGSRHVVIGLPLLADRYCGLDLWIWFRIMTLASGGWSRLRDRSFIYPKLGCFFNKADRYCGLDLWIWFRIMTFASGGWSRLRDRSFIYPKLGCFFNKADRYCGLDLWIWFRIVIYPQLGCFFNKAYWYCGIDLCFRFTLVWFAFLIRLIDAAVPISGFRSRSACYHVVLFELQRWTFCSFRLLRFYYGQERIRILSGFQYQQIWFYSIDLNVMFKIGMLTCRSVQATGFFKTSTISHSALLESDIFCSILTCSYVDLFKIKL